MKTKSIKFSIIALLISLVCGLGFALQPNKTISASAEAETAVVSQYMLVGGNPEKTTENAGLTTGYGKVLTGDNDINISTKANDGFVLVGWYIVYNNDATNNEYVEIGSTTKTATKDSLIQIHTYTVEDKEAILSISTASQDLQIEPVFDYEYYKVEYRDVNTGLLVNKGEFKYGDTVSIAVDVNSSVNVDVLSVAVPNVTLVEKASGITENYYSITKDASTGRTTAYEVVFDIVSYNDVVVEVNYDVLYKVDLTLQLAGVKLEDTTKDEYKQIFSAVTVNNVYKELNAEKTSFFVKSGTNFNVAALKNYSYVPVGEGNAYIYYNLKTLDGAENVYVRNYNEINANKEIVINYEHAKYNIDFVGVMYDKTNKTLTVNNALQVKDAIETTRVADAIDIDETYLEQNVGYTFEGFAIKSNSSTYDVYSSLDDVKIDATRPRNITIYVAYTNTLYTVKLNKDSLTNITLTNDKGETVYPISALTVNGTTKTIAELLDTTNENALLFDGFVLGNTVTLSETVNNGFTINGFYHTDNSLDIKNEFVLDTAFLTGKTNVIELSISAELKTYTFNYSVNAKNNVLMSTISIANRAALESLYNGDANFKIEENTVANTSTTITVSGVHLYTEIVLKSVPNQIAESTEYYVFNWFTADGKTRLTHTVNTAVTPNEYLHTHYVNQDATTITVVYSQPSTYLVVEFEGLPLDKIKFPTDAAGADDANKITFALSQTGVGDIAADNGVYDVKAETNFVLTLNNVSETNDNLFGYRFIGFALSREDEVTPDDTKDGTSTTYTYAIPSSLAGSLFTLTVKFEKIQYNVLIETKDGAELFNSSINIENPVIRFNKTAGYYVNSFEVELKDAAGYDNSGLIPQQTNATKSIVEVVDGESINLFNEYYHKFSVEEFKNLINTCAYKKDADNILDIYVLAEYALYRYTVDIDLVKYYDNAKIESLGGGFPTIELYYNIGDGSEDVKVNTELVSGYQFNNIPYGANVTLKVLSGAGTGYELKGWYFYNNSSVPIDNQSANRTRTISSIAADYQYAFRIDYVKYKMVLDYTDGQGNPTINDQPFTYLKTEDSISIVPNAILANGYLFNSLKYSKPVYTEYVYSDVTWNDDCANLYILDGSYIKNASNVYNNELTYYTLSYEEVVVNDVDDLTIFDATNFKVEKEDDDNIVRININYSSASMELVNVSDTFFNLDKLNLTNEDLASYSATATCGGNTRNLTENNMLVTVDDVVTITVSINTEARNSDPEINEIYNLTRGLRLNSVFINGDEITFERDDKTAGVYRLSFFVSNVVTESSAENGILKVNYNYAQIRTTLITVTTNMANSSSFIAATNLIVNNGEQAESNGNSSSYQTNDFLNSVYVKLELGSLNSYFKSKKYSIYHTSVNSANLIKTADYATYYINPVEEEVRTADGKTYVAVTQINLRATDKNIIIVFETEPSLFFEGKEAIDGYKFTPTYKIDEDGNGVAQTITLGENASLKNNINGYGISEDLITVEYYKNGAKLTEGAIDVGEYEVKLKLKDSSTDHWLKYIQELPYKITMNIQPLQIKLKPFTTKFTRQYDSTSSYDMALEATSNGWESADGFINFVGNTYDGLEFSLENLNFNSDYVAEITITGKDGTQKAQSNVTNRYVNIHITNLNLINNPNLVLEDSEFLLTEVVRIVPKSVEIKYLDVYDKVYNGDEFGTFGLVEGYDEYEIYYTHQGDDIYLIPENIKIYFAKRVENKEGVYYDVEVEGYKYVYDMEKGPDKYVIVDATNALAGEHSDNYVVRNDGRYIHTSRRNIYQDVLTATVKGYGDITISNIRGLTDHTKANLIPFDSKLVVEVVEPDSVEYVELYKHISKYLSRTNVFAVGYKLSIVDGNGNSIPVSNELHLTLPKTKDLTGSISLSGELANKIQYTKDDGNIIIDLKQINEEVSYIILTQNRALLELWQIILIGVGVAAVGGGATVAVIVIRRKKARGYSGFDKI